MSDLTPALHPYVYTNIMTKQYTIQKQFIPVDPNIGDPLWAKRQIWVYKINENDEIYEFDTLEEAQTRLNELTSSDPSSRVYRITELVSGSYIPVG